MLRIPFAEATRSQICLMVAILIWAVAFASLSITGIGLYIELSVTEYTKIVEHYNADAFFYFLVASGIILAMIHSLGGFLLCVLANPSRRKRYMTLCIVLNVGLILSTILELVAGIMCFIHIQHLHDTFLGGITLAMGAYASEATFKEDIDRVQMDFQCCGNDYYEDWFTVKWQIPEFANSADQKIYADSVPFSCCNPAVVRDCITHAIHQNERHINYSYMQDLTVHKTGCREALMDFFGDKVLTNSGVIIIAMFGFENIILILVRLLQTSMATAIQLGDPTATSDGYLFDTGGSKDPDNKPLLPSKSAIGGNSQLGGENISRFGSEALPPDRGSKRDRRPSVLGGGSQPWLKGSLGSGYVPMGPHLMPRGSSQSGYLNAGNGENPPEVYSAGSIPGFIPPPPPGHIPVPPPPPPPLPSY